MTLTENEHPDRVPAGAIARALRRGANVALDALMPPQCLSCGASIERHGSVCSACWSDLSFIAGAKRDVCGTPFELAGSAPVVVCGACARERPIYHRARAALRYDDPARRLILAFKRGDRTEIAPLLATWLRHSGRELLEDVDVLVPVPLHRWRLFQRRYNQAALLAAALGGQCGRRVLPEGLVRRRPTPSQSGHSRAGRWRNVAGAFAVGKRYADVIFERNIVLVDDVLTTGATVTACVRCLLDAGARRVDVLTVARVVRDHGEIGRH